MGSPRSKDKDLRPYLKDPKTRVCVQMIYLGEDSRKHLEVRQGGETSCKGGIIPRATQAQFRWGTLGARVEHATQCHLTRGPKSHQTPPIVC